jgi:hypothetical protein
MRHFLAYGHSDQATFRSPTVQASFDYLTVPGTIAAFYPDATAAFVLSSEILYVIDPRTPLFQERIELPRASHFALAAWHGERVESRLGSARARRAVTFPAEFYDDETIREMAETVIAAQRNYGQRALAIQQKLDRYRRLLAEAQSRELQPSPNEQRSPAFVIAPYFVSDGNDGWAPVNERIMNVVTQIPQSDSVSAMIAVDSVDHLAARLRSVPEQLSSTVFFWTHRFDERTVPQDDLQRMWSVVADLPTDHQFVNFYGGFFSICMGNVGLWGFNNGLGYSESREWPELSSTGAAPARYYFRQLHAYVSTALGQLIVDRIPDWACTCEVCIGRPIVALGYHDLKRHFALSRRWEIDLVATNSPSDVAERLRNAANRYETIVLPNIPPGVQRLDISYLRKWANVLVRA